MSHPEDNSAILGVADDIRVYEREQAAAHFEPLLQAAEADLAAEKAAHAATQKTYDDHMATHTEPEEPVTPPTTTLTKAQRNIGIQVFPDRLDLSYGKDLVGTYNMLKNLRIKKVRGGLGPATTKTVVDWYNKIYDELGIKACLTVGKPRDPLSATEWTDVELTLETLRGVETVCGWNEPNHNRDGSGPSLTNWQVLTINHNAELMKRCKDRYKVGSAQLWSGQKATHDADLKSLVAATGANGVKYKDTFEVIVWHLYQSGETRMKAYETLYTQLFGDRPIICSETGMSTAPNQAQGAMAMSEPDQAAYLKDHLSMYLNAGHEVYWFELRDEYDPAGTDREDWLGIYRHDGTAKPAVRTLKTLLAG